jgi:glutamate synthase domain-containing protein 1
MCGIAGIYRRTTPDPCHPARIVAMTDALTHRGPDDCGYLALSSSSGDFRIGRRRYHREHATYFSETAAFPSSISPPTAASRWRTKPMTSS